MSQMVARFQSSPARKGGCYPRGRKEPLSSASSFNPHPPERAGATRGAEREAGDAGVSILTRPKGRVLPQDGQVINIQEYRFQSSPARKGGCYPARHGPQPRPSEFQSSPARKGGCYQTQIRNFAQMMQFQSSPARKGGCYPGAAATWFMPLRSVFQSSPARKGGCYSGTCTAARSIPMQVSILTRPKGRVLPVSPRGWVCSRIFNPHPPERAGATNCAPTVRWPTASFQSSPARKGGCYMNCSPRRCGSSTFQSSPALSGGCYLPARRVEARESLLFNPHPPERAGATAPRRSSSATPGRFFNPHPPERAGATSARYWASSPGWWLFNPHPPERAGATISACWTELSASFFQSSPARTGGCYPTPPRSTASPGCFQSSPALSGGCYLSEGIGVWMVRALFNPHPPERAGAT